MTWEKVKLEDVCSKITSGGTPKSTNLLFYYPEEIPWLKTKEVNYSRIYNTETYISKEGLKHSSAKIIPVNSVIVAMYGQGDTAGRVAINKIPLCTNQACCNLIINSDIADYEYVYYVLVTLYEKFVSLKNGGAQPNLNVAIIKSIEIPLPTLEMQHKISSILSAYDDLIENTQKQIKLLEEAAQRLYKEWFVDLHFPGYETTPIIDGVPEGWRKSLVGECAIILRRGISPAYNENGKYKVINQKCIRQTVVDFAEARKQEKTYSDDLNLLDSDTVICSTGAGTLGRVGQIFGNYPKTTFDSHITLVRANEMIGKQYLFHVLKSYQSYLMGMGKGSTNQLELSRNTIQELTIHVPTSKLKNKFESLTQPIHDKIALLNKEIKCLCEARDRLLSKLMNGELEV